MLTVFAKALTQSSNLVQLGMTYMYGYPFINYGRANSVARHALMDILAKLLKLCPTSLNSQ